MKRVGREAGESSLGRPGPEGVQLGIVERHGSVGVRGGGQWAGVCLGPLGVGGDISLIIVVIILKYFETLIIILILDIQTEKYINRTLI